MNKNIIDDNIKPKFITQGYKKFPKYVDIYDEEGHYHIDETNIHLLKNVAEVVVYRHFRNYINDSIDKEELEQVALVTMIERLAENKFDPTKGIIKNYLYTAARNGVTNYVYHFKNNNKEVISYTLPENLHIDNSVKTITQSMLISFMNSIDFIYRIPLNDLAIKLYKEGFPINANCITSDTLKTNEYKVNKTYIKFINYYKGVL